MKYPSAALCCAVAAALLAACPSPRPAARRDQPSDPAPSARATQPNPPAAASASAPARHARVVATHPLGVPLHPAERSHEVSGRLADGMQVTRLGKSADGRWLEVLARDGQRGWITSRYAPELAPEPSRKRALLDTRSEYYSKQACEKLVEERRATRHANSARIMSYNVRHFPDGSGGAGTDIDWLACVIASSGADLVGVQEFKNQRHAKRELDGLLRRIDELTQGRWVAAFDDCPGAMHVGVLYDASRVQASSLATYASLNPKKEACKDQLRPGFGGYFRFPGGFDAHVISVHLKSESTRRALDLRRESIRGLREAVAQAERVQKDTDVIFLGDLNSMGCRKCSPKLDSDAELAQLDELLENLEPPFRRVPAHLACSHYYHGEGTLLDHFVVTKTLSELATDSSVTVSGYCGELGCKPLGQRGEPSAYLRLSDHCPIVLDFTDRDLD